MANVLSNYLNKGWCQFPFDDSIYNWVQSTKASALATTHARQNAIWYRYQNTWFVGVNVLPNDNNGAVPDGTPLSGAVIDFLNNDLYLAPVAWDKAQVSVCYPGYPEPCTTESKAAFDYRVNNDAAHVDGLVKNRESNTRHPGEGAFVYTRPTHQ